MTTKQVFTRHKLAVVGIYQEAMLFKEANEQMLHANRLVNSPVADNLGEGELGWCAHTS